MRAFLNHLAYIALITAFIAGAALAIMAVLRVIDWIIAGNWLIGVVCMGVLFVLLYLIDTASARPSE